MDGGVGVGRVVVEARADDDPRLAVRVGALPDEAQPRLQDEVALQPLPREVELVARRPTCSRPPPRACTPARPGRGRPGPRSSARPRRRGRRSRRGPRSGRARGARRRRTRRRAVRCALDGREVGAGARASAPPASWRTAGRHSKPGGIEAGQPPQRVEHAARDVLARRWVLAEPEGVQLFVDEKAGGLRRLPHGELAELVRADEDEARADLRHEEHAAVAAAGVLGAVEPPQGPQVLGGPLLLATELLRERRPGGIAEVRVDLAALSFPRRSTAIARARLTAPAAKSGSGGVAAATGATAWRGRARTPRRATTMALAGGSTWRLLSGGLGEPPGQATRDRDAFLQRCGAGCPRWFAARSVSIRPGRRPIRRARGELPARCRRLNVKRRSSCTIGLVRPADWTASDRLTPGARLGRYEVVAPLGGAAAARCTARGLPARDSRLGREVALKVLPRAAAADRAGGGASSARRGWPAR